MTLGLHFAERDTDLLSSEQHLQSPTWC